jgi:oligopeptide transport system ATP-binding protein
MKMANGENLLEVRDLKMHFPMHSGSIFGGKRGFIYAVDGVSFAIKSGETLGMVGESGCGKSTCLRAVAQLYRPTAGSVTLEGQELTTMSPSRLIAARKDMQIVFQDPYASLNPRMTVNSIISEPMKVFTKHGVASYTRAEIGARVEDLMEKVGLSHYFKNRYPHEFSGGQRQRIGIARALAMNPKLVLCDEPVSALDVSIQAQIINLFQQLQSEFGLTYMFIAHDLAVIRHVSDRIAVMYLGKLVELAGSASLYKDPLHPYTQALLSAAPIPDPKVERKRQRIILTGDVPSPDKIRKGCAFYDRCPKRMDKCKEAVPVLKPARDGHEVACFLYHD